MIVKRKVKVKVMRVHKRHVHSTTVLAGRWCRVASEVQGLGREIILEFLRGYGLPKIARDQFRATDLESSYNDCLRLAGQNSRGNKDWRTKEDSVDHVSGQQ